ncbi:MAG: glycosyltransferase family 4 protein [Chloracidobacterium sp.]|nr:glycosyltransferase family 4 protein [Chloracidobacterium sp.]
MRILQVSSARTFGGGERHFLDLCAGLGQRGHEVYAALRPTNEWQGRLDIETDRVLHVSIRNSFGMFSAKRIARFARENGIDIIHAHVARDYVAASAAARMADTRLVLTRHVMFPMKSFHRFVLGNVDAAIAVSESVRDQLSRVFSAKKIHVIPNGLHFNCVDTVTGGGSGVAFRDFHSIPRNVPLIASIGELKVAKGQRDLVLAAHEVIKRRSDARFVIAGVDHSLDKKFRRELKRLVRVLGMENNFLWLDWLDDTAPLLTAADLFVSPSHTESFGLAILEAMAAGCPVVATATDGAVELIPDSKAIVPIKDPLSMAEAILWHLEHDDERRELGCKLKVIATANYSIERMIEATEAVYRALV